MTGDIDRGVERAEEAEPLASTLDNMHEGLQLIDRNWRYLYVNRAAAEHGRKRPDELLGRTMMECYPGIEKTEMFAFLRQVMTERIRMSMDNEFVYPDGDRGWFELRAEPAPEGILLLSLDVTERKQLETQLLHAQKLEAVGMLASSVAHDFNNVLTGIMSFASFAQSELEPDSSAYAEIGEVLRASERAATLTRQLLTFSRRETGEAQVVSLNEIATVVEPLLRRIVGEQISIELALADGVYPVRIDPALLEQVLLNLVLNARDAMSEGGRVVISTASGEGDEVRIAVTDEGPGIAPEDLDLVFEPFFTTKAAGRGTGLGLSTSLQIARVAGGDLRVTSEVGRGTTFQLCLPRCSEAASAARDERPSTQSRPGAETGTILVVDDDDSVRNAVGRSLERAGYQVLSAGDSDGARRVADEAGGDIDLLLTDVALPGRSGFAIARELTDAYPGIAVIYMSGYASVNDQRERENAPPGELLTKPFSPRVLSRRLRIALGHTLG